MSNKTPSNNRFAAYVAGKTSAIATAYITALVDETDALEAIVESATEFRASHSNVAVRIVKQSVKNDGTIIDTQEHSVLDEESNQETISEIADDIESVSNAQDDVLPDVVTPDSDSDVDGDEEIALYDDDALLARAEKRASTRTRKTSTPRVIQSYSFQNIPGCIRAHTSRFTKTLVREYRVDQTTHLDASQGTYAVECVDHGTVAYFADRRLGRDNMANVAWCEECQQARIARNEKRLPMLTEKYVPPTRKTTKSTEKSDAEIIDMLDEIRAN